MCVCMAWLKSCSKKASCSCSLFSGLFVLFYAFSDWKKRKKEKRESGEGKRLSLMKYGMEVKWYRRNDDEALETDWLFHSRHNSRREEQRRARWRDWGERGTGRQTREGEILTNHARIFMSCLHMNINKKNSNLSNKRGYSSAYSFFELSWVFTCSQSCSFY